MTFFFVAKVVSVLVETYASWGLCEAIGFVFVVRACWVGGWGGLAVGGRGRVLLIEVAVFV